VYIYVCLEEIPFAFHGLCKSLSQDLMETLGLLLYFGISSFLFLRVCMTWELCALISEIFDGDGNRFVPSPY
jgi:hypothetical protein